MNAISSTLAKLLLAAGALWAQAAFAAEVKVAVAANFTDPAKEIAAAFKARSNNDVALSFGSTGQFASQIENAAPFEVFLSADEEHPQQLTAKGLAVAGSEFTYAIGKLVLWSAGQNVVKDADTLRANAFSKLSIADPAAAPYGTAAIETLRALGLYDQLLAKIVKGASIAQAFQFVQTGNAELGFVALSQLAGQSGGSRWLVPQNLYKPIRQDATLLATGKANPAAAAFLDFMKGPEARAIIEKYGYEIAR